MSSNIVYLPSVQFMSSEYSLCPKSTVYVLRVQFMSIEYSICPQSPVTSAEHTIRVQFMSL